MRVIRDLGEYQNRESNLVVAFGNFDGVHYGHRQLIERLLKRAREINGSAAIFTFSPHPVQVLRPKENLQLLLSNEDKEAKLADLGIDILFSMPFNKAFSEMRAESFVSDIIINCLEAKGVVIGYNFNFGSRGSGNADILTEMGEKQNFSVEVVPPIYKDHKKVSSTLVRNLLLEGQAREASNFLGYHPYIKGKVIHGDGRGREIGFPTANLDIPEGIITPTTGVYAVRLQVQGVICQGVANIGYRPTFKNIKEKNIEIHLFDFNKDIYNQQVKIEFLEFIRPEKSFASCPELVEQIKSDVCRAKKIF